MLRRLRDWLGAGTAANAPATVPAAGEARRRADAGDGAGAAARRRTPAQRRGDRAEDLALAHLRAAGLRLVQRNYLARGGEIDLVMREGATLVFVEVRHRSAASHGDGLDSVGPRKQGRLLTAAREYLAEHPQSALATIRFDIVASGAGGLRWVRDAIRQDEGGW